MKKMLKKIKNRAGETLGETLVALLIASLALIMLAAAISTSTGIITKSSKKIDAYFEESNDKLVKMTETTPGVVTFSEEGSMIQIPVHVNYAQGELKNDEPVISFKVKEDD